MLLEFCLGKELCVSNTWFKREEKRKVAFCRMGENETVVDCMMIKKQHLWLMQNVKAVSTCI